MYFYTKFRILNLALFISKRYLVAKKSHNAINIITAISIGLVAVGTMALIVIMSVFNGLENLVGSLNSSISSDFLIEAKKAKYIDLEAFPEEEVKHLEGINYWVKVLEDNALLKYSPALEEDNPREFIGQIRGVEEDYIKATKIEDMMIDGVFLLQNRAKEYCVLGNGVASRLQIHLNDFNNPIHCYFPKAGTNITINPLEAISIANIYPSGVFSVQQEVDDRLVIASLAFVQKLMNLENKVTSIHVDAVDGIDERDLQNQIMAILGDDYKVRNKMQQNAVMYNIMKSEKWSSFVILAFILFIATFNLVGALSVLIIDKKADILNLSFMGANRSLISKIFLFEGFMVSLSGTILGLLLGSALVYLQAAYNLVPMQGSFVVESFPVELRFSDIAAILAVVIVVSMLAVIYPIKRLSRTLLRNE